MIRFPHLAQRLFNRPLAITPAKAEVIMAALGARLGVSSLFRLDGTASPLKPQAFWNDDDDYVDPYEDRGYDLAQGVAIIPVKGTLVKRTGTLRPYSGMTGYDGTRQNFLEALADPEVKALVLDIDSPGGEIAGLFDLVDTIYDARGEKPVWSILDEDAYSAAYALASAADRIMVPRSGGTGSIGVIAMHVDWSRALDEAGIKVTLMTYGARKADGRPELPLSDAARDRFQADIDEMGDLFTETVARNRGVASAKIRDQEAMTFQGAAGIAAGLADAVMAPDAAFSTLLAELG
jgi:signal peptide peptidase SppA